MDFAYSEKVQDLQRRVSAFMEEHVYPAEERFHAEIAENRPNEFISIKHLGVIANGVEDTESDTARAWASAYENYTFAEAAGGTRLVVDLDVTEAFEAYMQDTWPKALRRLKAICESNA